MKRWPSILLTILLAVTIAAIVLGHRLWFDDFVHRSLNGEANGPVSRWLVRFRAGSPFRTDSYFISRGNALAAQAVLLTVCAYGVAMAAVHRERFVTAVRRFFFEPGSAINLAVFRIVLFGVFAIKLMGDPAVVLSHAPASFVQPPYGLRPLMHFVPLNPSVVQTAWWVCLLGALCAAAGVWTRTSAAVAATLGVYVFGVSQLFGKVNHDVHHLIWFAALMAASPCGDALAVDARRSSLPAPATRYALPLRIVWVIMGLLYFFPGFWKLAYGGLAWIFSDNLRNQLFVNGFGRQGWSAIVRLDRVPGLINAMALMTVAFELGLLLCIFHRRLRAVAATVGFLFHTGTWVMMGILFYSLQACYVVFVPWDRVFRMRGERAPFNEAPPRATIVVGLVIGLGASATGFLGVVPAWPFSCYPTFQSLRLSDPREVIIVHTVDSAGRESLLDTRALVRVLGGERFFPLLSQATADPSPAVISHRLAQLWPLFASIDPTYRDVHHLRFYSQTVPVHPDDRRKPESVLLYEVIIP